jgi:ribonuclease P protein component
VKTRREFLAIQGRAQRVSTQHFVLLLGPSQVGPGAPSRLGITASKQVGNAVVRGRCKRLVREAFRTQPGLVPAGVDLIVIVRAGAEGLGLSGVLAEWAKVRGYIARRAAEVARAGQPAKGAEAPGAARADETPGPPGKAPAQNPH